MGQSQNVHTHTTSNPFDLDFHLAAAQALLNGEWMSLDMPDANVFGVVFAGDMLERVTNGKAGGCSRCQALKREASESARSVLSLKTRASLLGARTLLVALAPGITASNKKLLVTRASLLERSILVVMPLFLPLGRKRLKRQLCAQKAFAGMWKPVSKNQLLWRCLDMVC